MNMPDIQDQISMNRYKIQSVSFTEDFSAVLIQFVEPGGGKGPVIEQKTWDVDLRGDDELRQVVWDIADQVCDVVDRAYALDRAAK